MSNSPTIIIRRLLPQDEITFLEAYKNRNLDSKFMFESYKPHFKFIEYLELLQAHEKGLRLPQGFVPMSLLGGFADGKLVGLLSLRHELNDFLRKRGGHIGYVVFPDFRNKGYGKAMLAQSSPFLRKLGINKALVTCDDDNIGSSKIIESCGGVLENKVASGPGLPLTRRYWIDL